MNFNDKLNTLHENTYVAKFLCLLFLVFIIFSVYARLNDFKNFFASPVNNLRSITIADDNSLRLLIKKGLDVGIFGDYIPKELNQANIRQSILDLHVIGVAFSKNKNASEVILRFANGAERIYKSGDILPGGVKILHISTDGIVVSRDGILERLNLPKEELIFNKSQETLDTNAVDD